jgi:hypothetical protein
MILEDLRKKIKWIGVVKAEIRNYQDWVLIKFRN